MVLTPKDKKDIKEIVSGALIQFAEELIKPSFELVYKKFTQIDKRFDKVEAQLESVDRKLDLVAEKVTDHDKRIVTLESATTATS